MDIVHAMAVGRTRHIRLIGPVEIIENRRSHIGGTGRIELHPENAAFEVIARPAREVVLLGKVIEVRRYLETPLFSVST